MSHIKERQHVGHLCGLADTVIPLSTPATRATAVLALEYNDLALRSGTAPPPTMYCSQPRLSTCHVVHRHHTSRRARKPRRGNAVLCDAVRDAADAAA